MSVSALARRAGVDERSFRHVMKMRSHSRMFSAVFAEKIHVATGGAVDRSLWIPR